MKINWGEEYVPSQVLSVRVSREDYDSIKEISETYNLNPSTVARKIIQNYFKETKGDN